MDYQEFIQSKQVSIKNIGFDPYDIHPMLFEFQSDLVKWAIRKGKSALWAGTGLGKAQHIDDDILTPDGWKKIGDAKPGDILWN